jgi:transmembrane sensor
MTEQTPSPETPRESPDALDALLDRVAYRTPASLDVEGALRQVHQRMSEPVVHSLAARRESAQRPSRAVVWAVSGIAAAVILAPVGLSMWHDGASAPAATVERVVATGAAQRDSANLADGTRVLVEPSSELTIGAGYSAHRSVQLRGDAHFSVKHDSANPFEVRAGGAVITDLGTEFDAHGGADGVAVAVTSGSVKLTGESETGGAVLRAGDRALRGASLALASAELKRWYGLSISLADPALALRHVTASFSAESPKQVLDVITLAIGARYEMHGDTVVFRTSSQAAPRR